MTWSTVQRVYDVRGLLQQEYLGNLDPAEYSGTIISRSWTYDAAGRVLTATDPEGRYEAYTYDAVGRKLTSESAVTLTGVSGPGCHGISGAVCSTRRWEYDEVGNVTKEIIPTGSSATQGEVYRTYTYDKVQRLKTQTDELSRTWTYGYDANGNKTTVTDPLSRVVTTTYDAGDRPISVTDAMGHTITNTYDVWDQVVAVTDATSQVTTYEFDRAGRMTKVTDPLGHASLIEYDRNGNRTALTDPRGNTQTVTYDRLNRPISSQTAAATATVCSPGCSTTTSVRTANAAYTIDGLLSTASDFNGQNRNYEYDSARRLKRIDLPGSTPDPSYGYNKSGQRLALWENGVLTAGYTYDEWGRLLTETRGSNVVEYRYDRRHQVRVAYPDAKTVTSTYDAAGQITYLDDWRGSAAGRTAYTYDGAGRRTGRTLPNGVATSWTYDAADRLTTVAHSQGATVLFSATSTYDNMGRRLSQTDYDPARATGVLPGTTPNLLAPSRTATGGSGTPGLLAASRITGTPVPGSPNGLAASRTASLPATTVQTFTYDAAGRLIQEDRTGSASTVWTYDDAGNRTAQSTGTNTTTYSYDADNRLLSQTNGSVTTSFTYDPNGSMTGRSSPGETLAYAWDTAGRLSSITRNGTTQASFTYDGDGNRRSKTSGATTTTYVNDARGLSQVLQAITGTKTVSYVGPAQYDSSRPTETEKWRTVSRPLRTVA